VTHLVSADTAAFFPVLRPNLQPDGRRWRSSLDVLRQSAADEGHESGFLRWYLGLTGRAKPRASRSRQLQRTA